MADHSTNKKMLHIAMFPWLAFGHMIPYLELAKLIARKGHRVSFISAARNIDRLPKLPPNLSPLITFVKLTLPRHVPNLPENAEATTDVPFHVVPYLKEAFDGLRQPMKKFLETSRPDWILFDYAAYWLPPVARELGIATALFSIFIACTVSLGKPTSDLVDARDDRTTPEAFTSPPPWVPFPTTVAFKLYEVKKIFAECFAGDDAHVPDTFRFEHGLRGCDAVAVRGCSEFDSQWLELLQVLHGKQVLPVGQLPTTEYDNGDDADTWRWMKEWLDRHKEKSVVYVAFGSEAKPSQEELTEIALGLEMSELPFFWVLRTRRGEADTELIELPEGFEERTRGRGVVVTSWAPQLKILAHDSVGGLLTHSGWSSVVEAIQFERALILLPFLADQGLNARVLEEKKMGFSRNSVAESVRLVMVEDGGKVYRDKAREMKGLFGDRKRQYRYVDNLLDFLGTNKRN